MAKLTSEKGKTVDAKCMVYGGGGCFHVWYGSLGLPTAREVWLLAEKHVRETGHPVEVEVIHTTVIERED